MELFFNDFRHIGEGFDDKKFGGTLVAECGHRNGSVAENSSQFQELEAALSTEREKETAGERHPDPGDTQTRGTCELTFRPGKHRDGSSSSQPQLTGWF